MESIMYKTRVILASSLITIMMSLSLSCGGENKRKHLIDDFWSRMSESDVITMTHLGLFNWKKTHDNRVASRDGNSDYRDEWIEIADYSDLGIPGKLKLEFYNDRLMLVYFCTKNISQYMLRLKSFRGVEPIARWSSTSCDGIRIARGMGADSTECISWGDEELIGEADAWIRRNG
jgi:hypothetical protein